MTTSRRSALVLALAARCRSARSRGRPVAAEYVKAFVEEMNASGFIARSIARHAVTGLSAVK